MTDHASRIIGLYERHAHAFDAERSKALFERAWLDRFLANVPVAGRVLDLGCGSAEPIARYIIDAGRHVTGVDSSPTMIATCRKRFPQEAWHVADMRSINLAETFARTFAGVIAFDSFFHLSQDDQRRMFATFAEVAHQGAPLLFTSGPRAGIAMGTYQGEPLYHSSLDPQEYRSLLRSHGFDELAFVPEDPCCGGRTIWLAQRR